MRMSSDSSPFTFRRQAQAHLAYLLPVLLSACALGILLVAQQQTAQAQAAAKPLLIYSIDVEGGQATLFVSPSGKSLLIDTGWPGSDARDPQRILAAMHDAGIARIDHVLVTHFHTDHVGGVAELVKRVPIGEFLDHGVNREDSDVARHDFAAYLAAIKGKPRRILHPGDTISIPGLSIFVLTADGEHVSAVPGISPTPNAYCGAEQKWPEDPSENARSTGILISFGKFRVLDLGDLTGAKEIALVCPMNPIGTVDLYMVTHHGMSDPKETGDIDWGRSCCTPAEMQALSPRVAVESCGPQYHKGSSPRGWQAVHSTPGVEDIWQTNYHPQGGKENNSPEQFIANIPPRTPASPAFFIHVSVKPDGSYTVTNERNNYAKTYEGRKN